MISESDSDDEEIVITGDNRVTIVPNGSIASAVNMVSSIYLLILFTYIIFD